MSKNDFLGESYKRFFGNFNESDYIGRDKTKPIKKIKLTEQQQGKWDKIIEGFKKQFPTKALTVKEGTVRVNGHVVESFDKFITRPSSEIIVMLKNKANY